MLRKLIAVVILIGMAVFFLRSSEGEGVALLDWIRDPEQSSREHERVVAHELEEREAARVDLEARLGLKPLEDSRSGRNASPGIDPLGPAPSDPQDLLGGALDEQELAALLAADNRPLRGRLLGLDGRALADVRVLVRLGDDPPIEAVSDAEGNFELAVPGARGVLMIDPLRWTVLGGELRLTPGLGQGLTPRTIVMAERRELTGRVLDTQGKPLAGVELRVLGPVAASAAPGMNVPLPAEFSARTRSDAQGRFEFSNLPDLPLARLEIEHPGYAPLLKDLPMLARDDLELVLEPAR